MCRLNGRPNEESEHKNQFFRARPMSRLTKKEVIDPILNCELEACPVECTWLSCYSQFSTQIFFFIRDCVCNSSSWLNHVKWIWYVSLWTEANSEWITYIIYIFELWLSISCIVHCRLTSKCLQNSNGLKSKEKKNLIKFSSPWKQCRRYYIKYSIFEQVHSMRFFSLVFPLLMQFKSQQPR